MSDNIENEGELTINTFDVIVCERTRGRKTLDDVTMRGT